MINIGICEKDKYIDYKNPVKKRNVKLYGSMLFVYNKQNLMVFYNDISHKVPHLTLFKFGGQ
nr:hypothetical protein [Mucilaginibacter sp. E4BP6]